MLKLLTKKKTQPFFQILCRQERFIIEAVLKKAGYRRGKGKSIVPAISKNCQNDEEQIIITNKSKKKNDSIKEKIRRISSQQRKGKRTGKTRWKDGKGNKVNEVYLTDDGDGVGHSEV